MANWNVNTEASEFNVNESVDTMISERSQNRSDFDRPASFSVGGKNANGRNIVSFQSLDTSIVGINANQVSTVISAIDNYIANINKYLNDLDPTADANVAFKSEAVINSLKQYMDSVKTYVLNLVSTLKAFQDKLIDVKNQWESYAGNLGTAISDTAGENFAVGSQYTRTYQNPQGNTNTGGSGGAGASFETHMNN